MNQVVIKVIGNYSYQTSRCLGQGVYGKVYQGMQRETKQKVAIKKIDLNTFTNDKYLQNAIFSQIYLLKRFSHPNIVRFKDVLSSKNSLYIITEFCKNGDLKQMIKRKRFKQQQAFQIMRQLLSGFCELVKQKIIHRDLKPANILINQNVYKIGDFGFAKYVDNFGTQMLKSCVGSPIYMAPQILQRTQYTTKCDIWSLGIIFFQMLHGYPPWKARDQGQLLRSLKNVPITQVLKKSNLSLTNKGIQFLKKTLAFSQQQRIGWNDLFESYGNGLKAQKIEKIQKNLQDSDNTKNTLLLSSKQKSRINSSNTSNNIQPTSISTLNPNSSNSQWTQKSNTNNNIINTHNTLSTNTNINTNFNTNTNITLNTPPSHQTSISHLNINTTVNSSPLINVGNSYNLHTPDRNNKNSYYNMSNNNNTTTTTNNNNNNNNSNNNNNNNNNNTHGHIHRTQSLPTNNEIAINSNINYSLKKNTQTDAAIQWRQSLIYYHFYCLQMLTNYPNIQNITNKPQLYIKMLYSLASLVKNRSTYCLSMIVMQAKSNKLIQDIYKKMQIQHQSYEMIYNDIVSILQKNGQYKNIKNQYNSIVGYNQIICQERMQKMENFMISVTTQNAQILSQEVKKKVKVITHKDYNLVQLLDYILDVLRLALGKNKAIKEIQQDDRQEDQDIKQFVARVFGKVDRLSTAA